MKKLISLLLVLLLCLSLVFALAGCGEEQQDDKEETKTESSADADDKNDEESAENDLVGEWILTMSAKDMGIDLVQMFKDQGFDIDIRDLELSYICEFKKNGEMEMKFDIDEVEDWIDDFKDALKDKADEIGKTEDEIDDFVDEALSIDTLKESVPDVKAKYEVDGDKLIMDEDGDMSESTFKIKGDKLTITEDGESLEFTRK